MATLIELCESGELERINPLEEDEQPWRTLYATLNFIQWLDERLPEVEHNNLYSDLSPLEQVFAVFHEYVSGSEFLKDRRFKKLSFTPEQYVWEIKTDDIRIFGWVPKRDVFICCFGDSADEIKLFDRYSAYIAKTSFVRKNMNLDEPKCCKSKEYDDVISAKD